MRNYEKKSRESYNKIASEYDDTLEGRFTQRFKELLLEELVLNSESTVLDVACANGTLLKMISNKYFIKGYGIDISDQMIESARKRHPDMNFSVSGCDKTPFKDGMFDIITVSAAYHHFPDAKAFAKEAARIIKPQGMIYIAEVFYPLLLRTLFNPFVPLSKAGDVRFYAPKEIISNFTDSGFEFRSYKREGHIQVIGMKKLES